MAFAEISLADMGLRWAPATLAAAIDEIATRAGQRGKDWRDFAELVLLDSFTSNDVAEMFKNPASSAFEARPSTELDFLPATAASGADVPSSVAGGPRARAVAASVALDGKATRALLAQVLSWLEERCSSIGNSGRLALTLTTTKLGV